MAGVGVIFYVMLALRARLRELDWFARRGLKEPNLAELLDLVALGSVADVVPLDANNRILVHQGLARIRAGRARPGLRALLEVAGRPPVRITSTDLGFILGPRLNAAGRLDDMSLGIECLLCDDEALARDMAVQLDQLNQDRKAIEQGMQREALAQLKELSLEQLPFGLCLFDADWHQGVIGILASRLKERYHRPTIAFADAGDGSLKGSARSIPGFHIRDALDAVAARHPGLISKFGGHAMAAGLSLPQENFWRFLRRLRCRSTPPTGRGGPGRAPALRWPVEHPGVSPGAGARCARPVPGASTFPSRCSTGCSSWCSSGSSASVT